MRSERQVMRSLGQSIVALGDEAGCVFLVGPHALTVLTTPKDICVLFASDVATNGPTALRSFVSTLQGHGLTHPNVEIALALYAQLIQRHHAHGSLGFTDAGMSQPEILEFFRHRTFQPAEPLVL